MAIIHVIKISFIEIRFNILFNECHSMTVKIFQHVNKIKLLS